ncbi:alpha-hydroxy-acid oxidizing protein [Paenarthrobacter sp. YIM B13468]|uniref:alpha-hydroxy-acid oxidizing protein n=1 Tax=Paenarthrobacter sp. YIM B13468 TaxID=3366295 RepID=UPI00366D2317
MNPSLLFPHTSPHADRAKAAELESRIEEVPISSRAVGRANDAERDYRSGRRPSVDVGMSAISVSNQGGNKPRLRVGGDWDDPCHRRRGRRKHRSAARWGIRRGNDVAKALVLGAKAVLIRACLWGLTAKGRAGVETCSTFSVQVWTRRLSARPSTVAGSAPRRLMDTRGACRLGVPADENLAVR